jgi:peptidoglycan/xylan/chitin deacetylase (PgdA/CDA1 family)
VSRLTLSFDNGPFPGVTEDVLETLRDFELQATFFVCGKDASEPRQRALVERTRDEGHGIGNHTQTHSVELGATDDPRAPASEIGVAQKVLEGLTDERRLFRPSGGGGVLGPRLLSPAGVEYLRAGGYTLVLWNSVPRDWEDPEGWPARALQDIAGQPWTLVVLHDMPTGAMKQLPRFLEAALRSGTEIVQDLPTVCVPITRGAVTGNLDGLVSGGWPPASS